MMLDYQFTKHSPELAEYSLFLNAIDPNLKIVEILSIQPHSAEWLAGWQGIESIVCTNDRQELYDIDIRFAWGAQVCQQHLYDYGWNQTTLLCPRTRRHKSRHKLIIYLCNPTTGLVQQTNRAVPAEFIIGKYWRSIHHYYLPLPCTHPFALPAPGDPHDNRLPLLDSTTVVGTARGILAGGLRTKGIARHSNVDRPLISVITVVFNGEQNLEQTIQSVINQNHPNFEYIIIDGGSRDGTLDIIQKYADRIDYWHSAKDMGLYDAMNQGIALAAGQWLNFMNCGDFFYSHQSLSGIPLDPSVDFYYSDTILYDKMGTIDLRICSKERKDVIHQSMVYQKSLHANYQYLVHDKLSISDYFFFRKNDRKNWCKLDTAIAIYNTEGISVTNSKGFIQRLFVEFMVGDISEFQMAVAIMAKILRAPLRIARNHFRAFRARNN
jgi:Glycosyl transferase family 2